MSVHIFKAILQKTTIILKNVMLQSNENIKLKHLIYLLQKFLKILSYSNQILNLESLRNVNVVCRKRI